MEVKQIRSRILEIFSKECLIELNKICQNKRIADNNAKVEAVIMCLNKYEIDYVELGPGTNRFAILIDGYVFKIALDKWGVQDNLNELTISEELQPFVSKTYECNELILVAEYVTVISREEFAKKREQMEEILSIISEGYLLGDVGIVPKNFCNWGYRDTGELVILDYAYIYRIIGDEMLCSVINEKTGERCGAMLEYDNNFHNMFCPRCRAKYTTIDVRRRIPTEHEKHENDMAKQTAYAVTQPLTIFTIEDAENNSEQTEENNMGKSKLYDGLEETIKELNESYNAYDEQDEEDAFLEALNFMDRKHEKEQHQEEESPLDLVANLINSSGVVESLDVVKMDTDEHGSYVVESSEIKTEDSIIDYSKETHIFKDENVVNVTTTEKLTSSAISEDEATDDVAVIPTSEVVITDVQEECEDSFINDIISDPEVLRQRVMINIHSTEEENEEDIPEENIQEEDNTIDVVEVQQLSLPIHEKVSDEQEYDDEDDEDEGFVNNSLAEAFADLGVNISAEDIESVEVEESETLTFDQEDKNLKMLERIRKASINIATDEK